MSLNYSVSINLLYYYNSIMTTTQPINIPINDYKKNYNYNYNYNYIYKNDNIPDYPSTPDDNSTWQKKLLTRIDNYSKCNNLTKM